MALSRKRKGRRERGGERGMAYYSSLVKNLRNGFLEPLVLVR